MSKLLRTSVATGAAALIALVAVPAHAADPGQLPYSATTGVGVHNSYDKAAFPHFADALDSGAGMLEIDLWTNVVGGAFRVSHTVVGNDNNCAGATTVDQLRANSFNHDFAGCLNDIKTWHDAHPGHRPIVLKIEMKDGFLASQGRGPAQFDALVASKLGDAVYRPADLVGDHASLDEASQAAAWPTRSQLAGKFIIELIPGTVEEQNPFDTLHTDAEYAGYLRDLKAAGNLRQATAFPAVHNVSTPGDPRTRYSDTTLRPWLVFFDTDASGFVGNGIDTAWYDQRHYFVLLTDAQNVAPAIDGTNPTEQQALDRLNLLAEDGASLVSSDWRSLPSVLGTVVPRGSAR